VLVVESSAADRQSIRGWLTAEGMAVSEAPDIISALAACQQFAPDLILLQLRLNTWDGFEVIRRLKDDPKTRSTPVILLATSAPTAEKARGIDMGAVDFISKPFDPVELLARVNAALRTKALLDLLDQRAHLDGLTELANRHALQDELPRQVAACRSRGVPISVLMADLDHFKQVNDRHGHAAGDEVLRRAASALRGAVGPAAFLARYGGEEFVAICPGTPLSAALDTAERARAAVAAASFPARGAVIPMTASLGVACAGPHTTLTPHELLERADQALYRAKAEGRNAVWYWDPVKGVPAPARTGVASAR
jgi:diguanylate cyclase (GGDEF)-like protein